MRAADLFRKYRRSINSPYTRKDLTTIGATVFILIVIPLTVFIALQRFNLVSKAAVWNPTPGTTWQLQLTGTIDTSYNVQMYDIDVFDTPQSTINQLKAGGRTVICYFSAGSWEDWRPDADQFPASVKGKSNGWPGENWLDIRQTSILGQIMGARMDLAVQKGCDGVDPDNVDGYTNSTGFPLTASDQITYNRFLATAAHARNLSIGLKNDIDQVPQLVGNFDWALNEECFYYNECGNLSQFISAGKAVFQVEYNLNTSSFCTQANAMRFSSMKKNLSLDAWMEPCWSTSSDTTPPTVTITAPSSGATVVGSSVPVAATANDNVGVTRVEFYYDSTSLIGTDTTNPYSVSWNTTGVSNGSHSLLAKAYDAAGNVGTSSTVTVTVNNVLLPTADIKASGSDGSITINYNTTVTLSWTSTNATSCSASSGWSGTKATSGSESSGNLTSSNTYAITCTGAGGSASDSVTVNVSPPTTKTGDLNGDNKVDILDLSKLITLWGVSGGVADINKDGIVNVFDLSTLLTNWGT